MKWPTSAFGTFRTSLLELMMSVHWVKADIAVASRSDFASTSAQARGWGVVKSRPLMGAGPVVLIHTQEFRS